MVKFYKRIFISVTPAKGNVEKVRNTVEGYFFVTPVKTGVQKLIDTKIDSRLRGNDMDNGTRLYCSFKGFSTLPKAGVQSSLCCRVTPPDKLDSRLRENDKGKETTLNYPLEGFSTLPKRCATRLFDRMKYHEPILYKIIHI